jgi:hypothetical protein
VGSTSSRSGADQQRQLRDAEGLAKRLRRCTATEAVALVAALEVVVLQEPIEVTMNLDRLQAPGGTAGHAEALVEERAFHPLDEAGGAWRAHSRGAVLDVLDAKQQFERVLIGAAAEFAAVVG